MKLLILINAFHCCIAWCYPYYHFCKLHQVYSVCTCDCSRLCSLSVDIYCSYHLEVWFCNFINIFCCTIGYVLKVHKSELISLRSSLFVPLRSHRLFLVTKKCLRLILCLMLKQCSQHFIVLQFKN